MGDEDRLSVESIAGVPCCTPAERAPATVLAWSEARVDEGAARGPSIALWLPAGVHAAIGIGQRPERELEIDAMRRDGVGLVRRQSGGGAVLLCPGVLCWEAWAKVEDLEKMGAGDGGIRQAYAALSKPVIDGLARMGIEAFHAGICDISTMPAESGIARKLAGTAQLRRRDMVLVHGSLLVNPELELLQRYLKFPSEQPDYRQGRTHRDFCISVVDTLSRDAASPSLPSRVAGAVATAALADGWETMTPPMRLDAAADALLRGKYSSDAWNWEKIRPAS